MIRFLLIVLILAGFFKGSAAQVPSSIEDRLKDHVFYLAGSIGIRNPQYPSSLDRSIAFIEKYFRTLSGFSMERHTYSVKTKVFDNENKASIPEDKIYANLIFEKKGKNPNLPIIIVSAHYDTVRVSPGADDNASGVAVMMETAASLSSYANNHTLRFIAFTLEEPPYFMTKDMGSYRYVNHLRDNNEKIALMINLDMVGFYSDLPIQNYPSPELKTKYPAQGNFILVIGHPDYNSITSLFFDIFKKHNTFSTYLVMASPDFPMASYSDHGCFWEYGYPAVMLNDTAMYRNLNYHTPEDIPTTLDYKKMAEVSIALVRTIQEIDSILER